MTYSLGQPTHASLELLAFAVDELTDYVGRPELGGDQDAQWYQFDRQDEWPVILVKAARVVSGLHAIRFLWAEGFTQEAAVIFRTVNECLDEITALIEPYKSLSCTLKYGERIKQFYAEEMPRPDRVDWVAKGRDRIGRDNALAAVGRMLDPDNPSSVRDYAKAVATMFDGYVHASYPASMTMYNGLRFEVKGGLHDRYRDAIAKQMVIYIERSIIILSAVAHFAELGALFQALWAGTVAYQNSDDYREMERVTAERQP